MRWSCDPSCFLSVNMCFCHVSLQSRWMPGYLAVSLCGICCPFNVTAGTGFAFLEEGNMGSVMNSENLNLLEPFGPLQACNGDCFTINSTCDWGLGGGTTCLKIHGTRITATLLPAGKVIRVFRQSLQGKACIVPQPLRCARLFPSSPTIFTNLPHSAPLAG